jgi:hypothetical protein
MTYFLAYFIGYRGLSETTFLFKLNNEGIVEMVDTSTLKLNNNNIYGGIYFAFIDASSFRTRKWFIKTTIKPIFTNMQIGKSAVNYYFYAFRLLQRNSTTYHPNYKITTKGIRYYVKDFIKESLLKYRINNNMEKEAKDYIVCVYCSEIRFVPTTYATDVFVNIYIVESIPKEEAIKIIEDNESLILWELL